VVAVTFYGAVRTVTGSMHLVDAGDARFLLDCGLFQGRRSDAYRTNSEFPFPPSTVDAVVLSHAHLDHCGNLPTLVRQGFGGSIFCTPATRDLAALILRDSAEIQQHDSRFVNKIRARQGQPPVQPLYVSSDAEQAITRMVAVPYHQPFQVGPAACTFYDAGHILGSAVTSVEVAGRTLAFSGDLGRSGAPILRDPEIPPASDVLIMESTYGNRVHAPFAEGERQLADIVRTTASRGGKVLIPSFAVGRTQDITYTLHRLREAGLIPSLPAFVDSPMAIDATEIFRRHPDCFDAQTRAHLDQHDPFGFKHLRYVRAVDGSKELNDRRDPFIVIATSGMCESGRILHHLRHHVGDPQSSLVFVSFLAGHTLGRRLADGVTPVNIFGEPHEVRAQVHRLDAYSAHADRDGLLAWADRAARAGQIYLVHGEEQQSLALAEHLQARGRSAVVPERGQRVQLD
jgi:metallo-beta-lactamase family protein